MKIVILQGSPNKKGSTSLLAENFAKGAREAGHEVECFDIAKTKSICYNASRQKEITSPCGQKE